MTALHPAKRQQAIAHIAWYGVVLSPPFASMQQAVAYVIEKASQHYRVTVQDRDVKRTTYLENPTKIRTTYTP